VNPIDIDVAATIRFNCGEWCSYPDCVASCKGRPLHEGCEFVYCPHPEQCIEKCTDPATW
jgi:hypothetical protein